MKIAYFDMFSGVSGDMILGALADCGVPLEVLKETAGDLGLKDVKINLSRGEIQGIAAVKIDIESGETHSHRSFNAIRDMIRKSTLAEEVKETAVKIFQRLGEAEARVHGVELEKIHFHEVGAVDSIVDIVGAVAAFYHLGIKKYYASAFRVGSGFVEIAHGRLPLPVPATVELIEGCPVERTQVQAELTTPTGAAIVSTLVRKEDFLPAGPFTFNSVGYGQGTRRLADRPNLLRIALGEEAESLKDT
ncbi:MAG TPA: LarC family nickel insertion protein, partial [archaeon]|nr:LarC family nickel insertion protein [archaeon]